MRVLFGREWSSGVLDYHRERDEYRVAVRTWNIVTPLGDIRIRRHKAIREYADITLEYLREFGFRATHEVINSRTQERRREDKYLACGLGRVVEAPEDGPLPVGAAVAFLAPCHPACVDRIVLPAHLLSPVPEPVLSAVPEGYLWFRPATEESLRLASHVRLPAGWSRHAGISGAGIPAEVTEYAVSSTWPTCRPGAVPLALDGSDVMSVRRARHDRRPNAPRAALFGYGQHARTVILPSVRPYLAVTRVHELDPTPIPDDSPSVDWSTSPQLPTSGELDGCTAALLAGYHHTHAPLAVDALDRGIAAVVEKPVATNAAQLEAVLDALERSGGRLFTAYHRRYHRFTEWAREDLCADGRPISYHCIVFEHPLPSHHWYRWPSSRSSIVSNGCHWIDHFLFFNRFAEPARFHVEQADGESVYCSITLKNGALFTMTITSRGSGRCGVRNYTELRSGGTTVQLIDDTSYSAENDRGILRRASAGRMHAYRRTYESICQRITSGQGGDSLASIRTSAGLVVAMDSALGPARSHDAAGDGARRAH